MEPVIREKTLFHVWEESVFIYIKSFHTSIYIHICVFVCTYVYMCENGHMCIRVYIYTITLLRIYSYTNGE